MSIIEGRWAFLPRVSWPLKDDKPRGGQLWPMPALAHELRADEETSVFGEWGPVSREEQRVKQYSAAGRDEIRTELELRSSMSRGTRLLGGGVRLRNEIWGTGR